MNPQLSATIPSQIRNRMGRPTGGSIHNYTQPSDLVSATETSWHIPANEWSKACNLREGDWL